MSRFDKLQQRSPDFPRETCPKIDEAIAEIRGAAQSMEDVLEALREDNAKLRENACYWRDEAADLVTELEALEEELEKLQAEAEAKAKT